MTKKIRFLIASVLLTINGVFALYTAGFGLLSAVDQRALHWLLLSTSLFLMYEPPKDISNWKIKIGEGYSLILAITTISTSVYLLSVWEQRTQSVGITTFLDQLMAVLTILIVIEATRRATGKFLMIITLAFLAYALYGPLFPSPFDHRGQSLERLADFLYYSTEGIFGIPMGISATFIIIFVLFGAFLEKFGGGKWFIDVSYALTGRYRGGPAKTSVIASGFMGMLSGSPVANAATTGTFTIPLIKKVGYKPTQAGAIEAVASTGGMITPPIMGAGAFIMAEYLGVPYQEIVFAAIIPAFIFYVALLLRIDAIAHNQNLLGIASTDLPSLKEAFIKRGHLAIPLLFLIWMIISGRSPLNAAFWAIVIAFVLSFVNKNTRPNLKNIIEALKNGSNSVITIAVACASAGIIVGVISITGLGATISYALMDLSQGNIFLALLLCMIITIILGFGMPPTAVYIVLVSILIPPLVDLGVNPLAAHMFIFYYSTLGALTPPVAITAYAAAAIAKSDANHTGFTAFHLGSLAYIIPFMFVFSPELLLQGNFFSIVMTAVISIIAVGCWVAGFEGFLYYSWPKLSRVSFIIAALMLLFGNIYLTLTGIVIVLLLIFTKTISEHKNIINRSV